MHPYMIGRIIGLVLMLASLAAGWKAVPFKWIALAGLALFLIAAAIAPHSLTFALIGVLGQFFWYGLARGARALFGSGTGYTE